MGTSIKDQTLAQKMRVGISLVVQWLLLHRPNARGLGSITGQETRSCTLQLCVCVYIYIHTYIYTHIHISKLYMCVYIYMLLATLSPRKVLGALFVP